MATANEVFRDFVVNGIPSSGKHKPRKSEIRALLNAMQNGDADGIYDFIPATNNGTGTANAIEAMTAVAIPDTPNGALIALPIVEDNDGSPVVVEFNDNGDVYTIKTASGNDVAAGGLTADMTVAGYITGTTFRMLSDQASAAIQAAAEAAQAAAEEAAAGVNLPSIQSGDAGKRLEVKEDETGYELVVGGTGTQATLLDFGSGVGEGNEAADSAALVAALASGETTILVPERSFLIASAEYDIPSNFQLIGLNPNSSILRVADDAYAGGGILGIASGNSRIILRNFAIQGPFEEDDEQYLSGSIAIRTYGTKAERNDRILFEFLSVYGFGDCGIRGEFLTNSEARRNHVRSIGRAGLQWRSAHINSYWNHVEKIRPGAGGNEPYLNAYAIQYTLSNAEEEINSSGECAYNFVQGVPTWEGLDTHGGRVDFHDNIVEDTMTGIVLMGSGGGSSYEITPQQSRVHRNTVRRELIDRITADPRDLEDAGWNEAGAVASAGAADPNGNTEAFELVEDTSGSHRTQCDMAVGIGTSYVWQAYIAQGTGGRDVRLQVTTSTSTFIAGIDLSDGSVLEESVVGGTGTLDWIKVRATSGGFYHVRVKFTPDVTETATTRIYIADGDDVSYTGDGSSSIRVFFPEGFKWHEYAGPYARAGVLVNMYSSGITPAAPDDLWATENTVYGHGSNDHAYVVEGALSIANVLGLRANNNTLRQSNGIALHVRDDGTGFVYGSMLGNIVDVVRTINGVNDYFRCDTPFPNLLVDDSTFYRRAGNAVGVNITQAPDSNAYGVKFGSNNEFINFDPDNADRLPFDSNAGARFHKFSGIFQAPIASAFVNGSTGAVDGFGLTASKTGTGEYEITLYDVMYRGSGANSYRAYVTVANSVSISSVAWDTATQATVTTRNTTFDLTDRSFYITIFAGP